MPELTPYLSFNGNCAEAMRFYERTLNGKLEKLITAAETPGADCTAGDTDRIMHACLVFDGVILMAGDTPAGQPFEPMKGFNLTLTYPSADEGRRIFETLGEGGKVTMPFEETFWAGGAGMVIDRYGTPWIVNGALKNI